MPIIERAEYRDLTKMCRVIISKVGEVGGEVLPWDPFDPKILSFKLTVGGTSWVWKLNALSLFYINENPLGRSSIIPDMIHKSEVRSRVAQALTAGFIPWEDPERFDLLCWGPVPRPSRFERMLEKTL
jgi:hypothetical protein